MAAARRRTRSRGDGGAALEPEAWLGLELGRTWAGRSPAEISAAHARAAQLRAGGWGAITWEAAPSSTGGRGQPLGAEQLALLIES